MDEEEVEYEREDWQYDLDVKNWETFLEEGNFEDEEEMKEYLDELEKAKQRRADELENWIYTMMGPNAYYGVTR